MFAATAGRSRTSIFAKGKNANESPADHQIIPLRFCGGVLFVKKDGDSNDPIKHAGGSVYTGSLLHFLFFRDIMVNRISHQFTGRRCCLWNIKTTNLIPISRPRGSRPKSVCIPPFWLRSLPFVSLPSGLSSFLASTFIPMLPVLPRKNVRFAERPEEPPQRISGTAAPVHPLLYAVSVVLSGQTQRSTAGSQPPAPLPNIAPSAA